MILEAEGGSGRVAEKRQSEDWPLQEEERNEETINRLKFPVDELGRRRGVENGRRAWGEMFGRAAHAWKLPPGRGAGGRSEVSPS